MKEIGLDTIINYLAGKMSTRKSLVGVWHSHDDRAKMPWSTDIGDLVKRCSGILFPGFSGSGACRQAMLEDDLREKLHGLATRVYCEITAGMHFVENYVREKEAREKTALFMMSLPKMRRMLAMDVEATYKGDPAATSTKEVICCYPVIQAMTNYRIAHQLHLIGVPVVPRVITEMAHSVTGIDIHPGARIGSHFAIDHGTGVVIGETCVIGSHVKLYQGVTLGAKSFPLDSDGHPIKGMPRHPVLEDYVTVYSNATILGRITIAKGTVVGGNVWVTESTRPGEKLTQASVRRSPVQPEDWGRL